MALSDAELEQLRKVLYTHLLVLDTLLSSPDRWVLDLHIPIAGQLRVLLCDADMPVLLIYARERGIPLRVWGEDARARRPQVFFTSTSRSNINPLDPSPRPIRFRAPSHTTTRPSVQRVR